MSEITPKFSIPKLLVSQAHKEITHNEAILAVDSLLHTSIVGTSGAPPVVAEADAGKCWLVQAPTSGGWQGREDAIACWNGFDWRYIDPVPGMTIWDEQNNQEFRFYGAEWHKPISVPNPIGGSVEDSEARSALNTLLTHLRSIGLLAT